MMTKFNIESGYCMSVRKKQYLPLEKVLSVKKGSNYFTILKYESIML